MIRKILLVVLAFCGLWACKDDDEIFDVPVPDETISFEPVSGGAVMRYTLPQNTEICAICARYQNERGEEVTILGTPFTDSLLITGFNSPHTDVPVSITVTDNNNVESAPVQRTFSTLASAPYAFMDNVQVSGTWGGIQIESSYTGVTSGIVDVYRIGTNPFTKEIDTLYVSHFSITAGEQSNFIAMPSEGDETTVVLRSEDGNGNFVRTMIFSGLIQYAQEQYPQEKLAVSDPGGFSYEYEGPADQAHGYATSFGIQYLVDGDTKGKRIMIGQEYLDHYYTYVTNAEACGAYVQVELDEPQVIATVRLYKVIENMGDGWKWQFNVSPWFNMNYDDRLPNHIRVVASNDASLPMEEWDELGEFYQPRDGTAGFWPEQETFSTERPEDYDVVDPIYAEVVCRLDGGEYKYVRVVTEDHFSTWHMVGDNIANYISYHELEVYVKAE